METTAGDAPTEDEEASNKPAMEEAVTDAEGPVIRGTAADNETTDMGATKGFGSTRVVAAAEQEVEYGSSSPTPMERLKGDGSSLLTSTEKHKGGESSSLTRTKTQRRWVVVPNTLRQSQRR